MQPVSFAGKVTELSFFNPLALNSPQNRFLRVTKAFLRAIAAPVVIPVAAAQGAVVQLPACLYLHAQARLCSQTDESRADAILLARKYYHFAKFDLEIASKFLIRGFIHTACVAAVVASLYFAFTSATPVLALSLFVVSIGVSAAAIAVGWWSYRKTNMDLAYLHAIKNRISYRATDPELAQILEEYAHWFINAAWNNPQSLSQFIDTHKRWKITVKREELLACPESIIESLALEQAQSIQVPSGLNVKFEGEDGIDIGGPSRDFISQLLDGLTRRASSGKSTTYTFEHASEGAYPKTKENSPQTRYYYMPVEQIPLVTEPEISELLLEAFKDEIPQEFYSALGAVQVAKVQESYERIRALLLPFTPEEMRGFAVIGTLLAISQKNKYLPIGHVFHNGFFHMLIACKYAQLNKSWADVSDEIKLCLYRAKNRGDDLFAKMFAILDNKSLDHCTQSAQTLLTYVYCDDEFPQEFLSNKEADLEKIKKNLDVYITVLRNTLVERARFDKTLAPTYLVASSMAKSYSELEWDTLCKEGSDSLVHTVQGVLSKQAVKDALNCENKKLQQFFLQWLDEIGELELVEFVKAATGAPTLGISQSIKIVASGENQALPSFHSCIVEIHLPCYDDYGTFTCKLNTAIKESLPTGFAIL